MIYLDLNAITAEDLLGKWVVSERFEGHSQAEEIFARSTDLILMANDKLKTINDETISGKWHLFRETEIIYNPQLRFSFNKTDQDFKAMITRLSEAEADDEITRTLTLYFTSGLELVLTHVTKAGA